MCGIGDVDVRARTEWVTVNMFCCHCEGAVLMGAFCGGTPLRGALLVVEVTYEWSPDMERASSSSTLSSGR